MANAFWQLVNVMKTFSFGVELETIGATRSALAAAIVSVTGGETGEDTYRQRWTVTMPDGRKWRIEHDGSLSGHSLTGEVVTPILGWADLDMLQNVVRALRRVGATVNASCGMHVHVGVASLDGAALGRLAKLTFQQEKLLFKALQVTPARMHYCKEASADFIKRIVETRPSTREALLTAWYGDASAMNSARLQHRHHSRYRGLNLHAVQFHGTAEFRYFDGTLHAGKVKTYVQLCLALVAKASVGKHAVARPRVFSEATAKYDVRVFLLRLGMIGKEFATARGHLLDHLSGSSSRKKPAKPAKVTPITPPAPALAEEPAVLQIMGGA